MNIDIIKNELRSKIGKTVQISVYGLRNKVNTYVGKINNLYPNIFTLKTDTMEKSFMYSDLVTGEVKIKYLN